MGSFICVLTLHTYSSPSVPYKNLSIVLFDEDLNDVKFIIVGIKIRLIESCAVNSFSINEDSVILTVRNKRINSCSTLCDNFYQLLFWFCLFYGFIIIYGIFCVNYRKIHFCWLTSFSFGWRCIFFRRIFIFFWRFVLDFITFG